MGKTKAEIIDAYEKKLKEGLEKIEKATITFDTRDAELTRLIEPYTKIIYSQLCDDLKLNVKECKAVNKIFNWVRQGKSLENIKGAELFKYTDSANKIISSKKIKENLQYIFDAATVYCESIDTEKKRFRQSFKKMKITEVSDDLIKKLIPAGKLDEKNKNGEIVYPKKSLETENSISAYDLVQKNANNIVLNSYIPTPEDRTYGNYLRNPKLSDAQRLEIAEMSLSNSKRTECTQIIINDLMNIDIDKYINMSYSDILHNYDEFQYIKLMIHDSKIIDHTDNFLTEDEQALLSNYLKGLDTVFVQKQAAMDLDISNFSKEIDWRNMDDDQYVNIANIEGPSSDQAVAVLYTNMIFSTVQGQKDLQELETTKSYLTQFKESLNNRGFILASYHKFYDVFLTQPNGLQNYMVDLVTEAPSKIVEAKLINELCNKPTAKSYVEFCKSFNVKETLSDEDIQNRTRITQKAIEQVVKYTNNYLEATSFDADEMQNNIIIRSFRYSMLSPDPKQKTNNLKVIKAFSDKNIEGMKKAIEDRFKFLLSQQEILKRSYSDEELAENWVKLKEITASAGMEYVNFKETYTKLGVKIDSTLQKEMDDFHKIADSFNSKYTNRIDYMCSQYYKYGAEKELVQEYPKIQGNGSLANYPDMAFAKTAMSAYLASFNTKTALRLDFMANVTDNKQKELYGIFDSKYNELDEDKLEDCLVNGEEVIVAYKGDTKAQLVKVPDPKKIPLESQKQELSSEQKMGLSFSLFNKAAEAILKNEQLPKDEKMLTGSMLETQYKLAVFVDNQATNPKLQKDSQDLAAKLMAKVTILEMLKKTPVEEKEIRKTLISEKNINEFANKLKESGVAEIVANNLNKVTGSGVINLSTKELYKEMVKANKLVSEKDLAKKAPEQKLEGGPEKEVKAVLK